MKFLPALLSIILFAPALLHAETIALIEKTGVGKNISYELVTPEAMKEMQASAMESAKRFSKAATEAEIEWKKDPVLKNYPFPKTAIAAPKVSQAGMFTSQEKANARLEEMKKKLIKPEPVKRDNKNKKKPAVKKPAPKKSDKSAPAKLSPETLLKRAVAMVESRMAAAPTAAGTTARPAPAGAKGTAKEAGGYGVRNDAEDLE